MYISVKFIYISKKADKMYPYKKDKNILPLNKNTRKTITKNIRAMMMHKYYSIVNMPNAIIFQYIQNRLHVGEGDSSVKKFRIAAVCAVFSIILFASSTKSI